jgi:hypothetical protein
MNVKRPFIYGINRKADMTRREHYLVELNAVFILHSTDNRRGHPDKKKGLPGS